MVFFQFQTFFCALSHPLFVAEDGLPHPCCGSWWLLIYFVLHALLTLGGIGVLLWLRLKGADDATVFAASAGVVTSAGIFLLSLISSLVVYVSKKRALERKRAALERICRMADLTAVARDRAQQEVGRRGEDGMV